MKPFRPLKVRNYVEQVARLRVPLWTEHAHQALRRRVRHVAEFRKADGRIDVIAENRFARVDATSSFEPRSPPDRGRQAKESRADRQHAQTPDDPQRDDADKHGLATDHSTRDRLGDVPLAVESSTAAHDDYAMRFSSDDVTSPSC